MTIYGIKRYDLELYVITITLSRFINVFFTSCLLRSHDAA